MSDNINTGSVSTVPNTNKNRMKIIQIIIE